MSKPFDGFPDPRENWSKLPHVLINALPLIETVSELKVILYILRHTWGFHDDEKRITLDEFAKGRKRRDRSRLDGGTGLTIPSIRDGIKRAVAHGFIVVTTDDRDKARVKKFYSLAEKQIEKLLQSECKGLTSKEKEPCYRSEKETLEKKPTKEKKTVLESENTSDPIPESTTEIPEKTGDDLLDQYFGPRPERQPTECNGNSAIPVQAGGGHSPAHKLIDGICRYNGLTQGAESLPEKKRASWIKHIAEIIEQWGGATVEQAHLAWQAWVVDYAWKGAANPFYSTFETEIGPLLVGVREESITLETLKAKAHEANGGGAHASNKRRGKGGSRKGQWSPEEIAAANQKAADELSEAA
jgi:DNA-binding PadR family transcriptional regulator